jgi:threonyl-tRNA synthetase
MASPQELSKVRHSLSHLLAASVLELYPGTKFGVGPVIENGFYYDFLTPRPLVPEDLKKIEKRMRIKISQKLGFTPEKLSIEEAKKLFTDQQLKLELIRDLATKGSTGVDELESGKPVTSVTIYKTGLFVDLCRGGHVNTTAEIPADAFKLTHLAGAYWRGSEKNPMLTRIYGVAFSNKSELEDYLKLQEEIKKRDHRKLGDDLDLFTFADQVGKGLPMLTPRGAVIRRELERYIVNEEIKRGYLHVITPPLAKLELYKTSGHYPYYKDTMYPVMKVDEDELILRPMTCPHHFILFKDKPRSYRELPLRIAEIAQQFRYEKSGELTGLMRVRVFNLADSHIFCVPEQVESEISNVLKLIDDVNKTLGLKKGKDYRYRLSLGDRQDEKKYAKNDTAWDLAENILRRVLKKTKAPFYEAPKEAAFYGPKIDVQIRKINGQEETAFTVQYDFVMPERFDLEYIGKDGKTHRPVVIHRSSIGALERTMAFLLEHYAGVLPLWLAPVHVAIIPVGLKHEKACAKLGKELKEAGLRVEISTADQSVGKSIRDAEKKKVPYMLVIGDKESKSAKLHLREHGKQKLQVVSRKGFITDLQKRLMTRKS